VHNPKLAKVMGPLVLSSAWATRPRARTRDRRVHHQQQVAFDLPDQRPRARQQGGRPADKVEALLSGQSASIFDKREQVVYDMATCLSTSRWVSRALFERAVAVLGYEGILDVICLMGFYTSVSMTLACYAVPAAATGIARRACELDEILDTAVLFPCHGYSSVLARHAPRPAGPASAAG